MKSSRQITKNPRARVALAAIASLGALANAVPSHAATLGSIFYIAMENHNWTQPGTQSSPQQIYQNPAAPYINSLVTPGNPNAAQTAYATSYFNAGQSEHPSEPNYVWAEAGTNFNPTSTVGTFTATNQGTLNGTRIANDADPLTANGNIFTNFAAKHLTGQLNTAGVAWKNYEEDYQILNSTTPTGGDPRVSKSGTSTTVTNPYYNTNQYNYAAKHDPMAFFDDTATQNVNPMSQLATDLANNTVGKYNWITPNQYNDMHTQLTGGFTYKGTAYTGDAAMIAQGDNFLSILIPQIMASQAYQNNGAIVIWNDETEGGDGNDRTSMEIVISPLAKGNAYASSLLMSHSSDVRTMEELFGLPLLDNAIPTSEYFGGVPGQFASVLGSNDLSDLFVAGAIPNAVPEPASFGLLGLGGLAFIARRKRNV